MTSWEALAQCPLTGLTCCSCLLLEVIHWPAYGPATFKHSLSTKLDPAMSDLWDSVHTQGGCDEAPGNMESRQSCMRVSVSLGTHRPRALS